jgi:hypothetical protein
MSGVKSAESGAQTLSTDKNVLYIMLIIAVVTVMGYLMMGNFEAVAFFVIVAYLSTFFTKNMVVVFLISILATNFLMMTKIRYSRKEGMTNMPADPSPSQSPSPSPSPSHDPSNSSNPTTNHDSSPSPSPSNDPPNAMPAPSSNPDPKPTKQSSAKTSGGKNKEGMNGKLAPANFNDDSEDEGDGNAAPFPNKNKNVEKAHDNLQNIVGGPMNADQTDKIMEQQKILMDNMKTMQPFIETAERFLDKFNMKGIDGLLGKIGMGGGGASPSPSSGA